MQHVIDQLLASQGIEPVLVDIGASGVSIFGTMVNINSGGSAGSGSPPSPTSPDSPNAPTDAQEAKPTAPTVADDSKRGQKSAP